MSKVFRALRAYICSPCSRRECQGCRGYGCTCEHPR